ncbi:unnamed protein product [Trichobilharzia regenti]|nr:unnamed protein product [Trichobilharzia regenti]
MNAPQPNAVKEIPYPLHLTSSGKAIYFKVSVLI